MSYTHKALQLLADLGDTPADIADALHELGITGTRAHKGHCPLAHYLQNHIPYASVLTREAYVCENDTGVGADAFELTTAQTAFIQRFDQGEYHELIDTTHDWDPGDDE
jgi:hypothetical protein